MINVSIYDLKLVKEKSGRYDVSKRIHSPRDAYDVVEEVFSLGSCSEEVLVMLSLNTKNEINGAYTISKGSLNSSIVHPREVFKRALLSNAASIVIAHNHPSQDTTPSNEDIQMTERLTECGKLLGIDLLDHIIVSQTSFKSLKESLNM